MMMMTQRSSSSSARTVVFLLFLLPLVVEAADREFDYEHAPTCYPPESKNPARVYVPYYNMDWNVDCSNRYDYPDPFLVQCGLSYFGNDHDMSVNRVHGPPEYESFPQSERFTHEQHRDASFLQSEPLESKKLHPHLLHPHLFHRHDERIPGDEHLDAPNWIALSNIGKSQYATNGLSFSKFTLHGSAVRVPHQHSSGELCFIVSGTARVTVTGLPQRDANFRDPRYNLRRGENCADEINRNWWMEDHYEKHHHDKSNRHGGLRSSSYGYSYGVGRKGGSSHDHSSSGHSHSMSSKKGSKRKGGHYYSSSGDSHDHSDSHSHDYYHSATGSRSSHFHSDQHSHKGRWWQEWTRRNCTRTTESQVRYSETFLLHAGDALVVPGGYHHTMERIDDASFSEPLVGLSIVDSVTHVTFETPQVLKGLPRDVLFKSLGVETKVSEEWYKGKPRVYRTNGGSTSHTTWAGPVHDEEHLQFKIHHMNRNLVPAPRRHHHKAHRYPGNGVLTRAVDANNHKVMENLQLSAAYTEIAPGAILEPYWVDNADELLYVIEGNHLEIVRSPMVERRRGRQCKDRFIVGEGYLALHEVGTVWFIENKSEKTTAKLLRVFNNNMPSLTTLYEAYHGTPHEVLHAALHS